MGPGGVGLGWLGICGVTLEGQGYQIRGQEELAPQCWLLSTISGGGTNSSKGAISSPLINGKSVSKATDYNMN